VNPNIILPQQFGPDRVGVFLHTCFQFFICVISCQKNQAVNLFVAAATPNLMSVIEEVMNL
jgi:hypothetical protein